MIRQVPLSFALAVLLAGLLMAFGVWVIISWHYQGTITALQATNDFLEKRLADLEFKNEALSLTRPAPPGPDTEKGDRYSAFLDSLVYVYQEAAQRKDIVEPIRHLEASFHRLVPFLKNTHAYWRAKVEEFKGFCIVLSQDPVRAGPLYHQRGEEFATFKSEFTNGLYKELF